jgi:outer membrane protein TolC
MMKPMCVRASRPARPLALLGVLLLATSPLFAQQDAAPAYLPLGPLTLEQVLEIAESRSESVAIARAGVERADAERIRARSGLLPQLSGSASYERALASEFEGVFGGTGTGPVCPPFALDPNATIESRVAEIERAIDCGAIGSSFFGGGDAAAGDEDALGDLPFGRENTWRASLAFSQNLYSGGRNGAQLSLAAVGRDAARFSLTTTRGQLLLDVATAYYDALLSGRLVSIAEATVEQSNATLRQVQAGFDAGTQPEFEVLRARVNRDNQTPFLIRQRVNREIAMLRLKQLLDVPVSVELELADVLGDDTLPTSATFAPRVAEVEAVIDSLEPAAAIAEGLSAPLPDRTVLDSAEADVRRAEAALRLTQAEKMPRVSLISNYSRVTYPADFFPTGDFRTNWTVGASVEIPLLTGGRQRGDEAVARADVQEARARRQQVQELASLDTRLAWAELLAAKATWEASGGTVQEATRAYEIAEVRYQAGVSTQLELSDARLLLQQSQATRAQAARDVQVARARVALLAELPLGTAGSGAAGGTTTGGGGSAPRAPTQTTPSAPSTRQAGAGFPTTGGQAAQFTGR